MYLHFSYPESNSEGLLIKSEWCKILNKCVDLNNGRHKVAEAAEGVEIRTHSSEAAHMIIITNTIMLAALNPV